ncbi:MAG: nucleotidyltransferase family protein [Myxococcales bacterium]|nr:nucleotidyltransferase family protein [Myxococcales bacterium]
MMVTEFMSPPRVAGLILAAGSSRRMNHQHKVLAPFRGCPMIEHVVRALCSTPLSPIVVVTGHNADQVGAVLSAYPVELVYNPRHLAGMSTSLRAGISTLPPSTDGVLVALADMPLVQPEQIISLLSAFQVNPPGTICVPTFEGQRGHPVTISNQYFEHIYQLDGDIGARSLFERYADRVVEVPMRTHAVLVDIDTPEALAALRDHES